jgi:glyoxylase-like metal-dependent hydrolase (beta-lactamase superfamily II)
LIETERTVLVDTGLAHTPDEPLASAIAAAGAEPDLILITHADVDHCGGNRSMRELYPRAFFACPESDRRWIESNATMLAENYIWHAPYGLEHQITSSCSPGWAATPRSSSGCVAARPSA